MSWFMCAWSLLTMWLMSEQRYRVAWVSSFLSQFGWGWLAWKTNLWGMLAFSFVMVLVAARALLRLRRSSSHS